MYLSPREQDLYDMGYRKSYKDSIWDFLYNLLYFISIVSVIFVITFSIHQNSTPLKTIEQRAQEISSQNISSEEIQERMNWYIERLSEDSLTEEDKTSNPYEIMGVPTIQSELKKKINF